MQSHEALKKAKERGYEFTGIYDFYKEPIQERQKQLKALGYKCIMYKIHPSPLAIGGGREGYSLYIEKGKSKEAIEKLWGNKGEI